MRAAGAKIGVVAVLSVVGSLGSAVTSAAQDEPITGVCSFPITHEFPKVHGGTQRDFHGTSAPFEFLATGQVFVRITNVLNGKSVEVNSNAAAFYFKDGSQVFRGQVVTFFSTQHGDIPKGVWVTSGSMRATVDEDGELGSITGGVLRRDICAELA